MIGGVDSKQIIYLPGWVKASVILLFAVGLAISLAIVPPG